MTKDHSTTTGPPSTSTQSSCFLGCFGRSGKKTQPTDEVNSRRRRRRWSFSLKKSPTKTVPVDLTAATCKPESVTEAPVKPSDTSWEIQVVEENASSKQKHSMMVEGTHAPVTSGGQKTSRKKRSTTVNRKKETKAAASSATILEQKTVTVVGSFVSPALKPLPVSKTVPQSKQQKPHDSAEGRVLHRTPPSSKEVDSIIGMSIILVILVIMVLWGKLCAILCTCAWFFISRRLVIIGERSIADKRQAESHKKLDLESEEYKKRVVLEGLLQRNHRKVVGRL